jgi:hypothetical protein
MVLVPSEGRSKKKHKKKSKHYWNKREYKVIHGYDIKSDCLIAWSLVLPRPSRAVPVTPADTMPSAEPAPAAASAHVLFTGISSPVTSTTSRLSSGPCTRVSGIVFQPAKQPACCARCRRASLCHRNWVFGDD